MLWDPDADVDEVLDEFYESFGPMKQVVKDYFDYWEAFTVSLGNNEKFFATKRPDRLRAYPMIYSPSVLRKADAILARAKPLLRDASAEERERFRNIELGLQHGRLLAASLEDGKTSTGQAGKRLMEFRREIAGRNVINVYWTTSKEKRYRVFE
jgi:hypothetical protein